MLRIIPTERKLGELLEEHGQLYPRKAAGLSGGLFNANTAYGTLRRMEKAELVRSQPAFAGEDSAQPRRMYWLTAKGTLNLRATRAAEAVLGGAFRPGQDGIRS